MSLVVHDESASTSYNELQQTIQFTNEVMGCEGKKLIDLVDVLQVQQQKGSQIHWILEIEIQIYMFDMKKIRYDSDKHTLNQFRGYIHKQITSMHEILSVIPKKY